MNQCLQLTLSKGTQFRSVRLRNYRLKIEDFVVEIEDHNNESKEPSFLDSGVKPTDDDYRFRMTFEGNYLWGFVHKGQIDCLVRYGLNDPSTIVSIIQYQTERCLMNEHTYFEMENVFGDFEEEVEEC